MNAREFNFDGLVGPTHNYAGLSYGNVASTSHRNLASSPKQAALQGLAKMRRLTDMGIGQAVLPPLLRPRIPFLRQLGFSGSRQELIESVARHQPTLLACAYSASCMWTANAATVSPSADCRDGKTHLTVANLSSGMHRFIEAEGTQQVLESIFANSDRFVVHPALPGTSGLSDEGAANHTRLCAEYGAAGVEMFVFGRSALDRSIKEPKEFPARQTLEASEAVARLHGLDPQRCVFVQQNPTAIDAGVFHNDVISVGNRNVLLCHEMAFENQGDALAEVSEKFHDLTGDELLVHEVKLEDLSLEDCVRSYLFNSQLISRDDGTMVLICPIESQELESARRAVERIVSDVEPIQEAVFMDLRQSMNNGGGPACLRLRVCLNDAERAAVLPKVLFDENLYATLGDWVSRHYREELRPDELADPRLPIEVDAAFVELADILSIPLLAISEAND